MPLGRLALPTTVTIKVSTKVKVGLSGILGSSYSAGLKGSFFPQLQLILFIYFKFKLS